MTEHTTQSPTQTYLSAYFEKLGNTASIECFEIHASRYAHNYNSLLCDVPRTGRVLDAGCGVGQFLYYLHKQGFEHIDGIDYDAAMVFVAQSMVPDAHCAHASVGEYLADKPDSFALITMNDVIEHLPYEAVIPTLKSIYSALTREGVVVLKTPNLACPLGTNLRYKDFTHRLGFTESSLAQALMEAGFSNIQCFEEEGPVTSWRAALRKKIFLRGALRLWRFLYFCLEGLPAPKVLTQWVIVKGTKCVSHNKSDAC